ncbi:Molybdenum cofactor sulfurase [Dendrobium catenatum]|uniref:Molybdenum cofactor sulfurase n=1 Tax=Dendrobium catenatum TaxID=906689 RepID=A0A2I0W1Y6_9ASPA|nr:Molybdenum cofactor sulfurase [Dendrobium catenatum]
MVVPGTMAVVDNFAEITPPISDLVVDFPGVPKVTSPVLSNVRVMGPFVEVPTNLISPQALFARVGEETNKKLLTMFDHESQSIIWMAQRAREKGEKTYNASFKWPSLKVYNSELSKLISSKKSRKRDSAAGLFVFSVQSRVSGVKYPYQWMAMAQQNNWDVLLDAGALGPKDMDSLGLSLYRPDFIITSFYRVFGLDSTGFGCLLIKKSIIGCLQNPNGGTGSGMERLDCNEESGMPGTSQVSQMPAFSGAFTSAQVRNVVETEMDLDNNFERDGASTIFEETESVSVGERGGKEEPDIGIVGGEARKISFANGGKTNNSTLAIGIQNLYENDSTSEICQEGIIEMKESAIRRETECEFRLLERREGNNTRFKGGRFFGMEDKEHVHVVSMDRRVSFIMEDAKPIETFTHNLGDDDASSGGDYEEDDEDWGRREPEIVCRHIDHVNMMGLSKTTYSDISSIGS